MTEGLLRWGILATGNIAKAFARGLEHSQTGTFVAVGSRNHERAQAFAQELGPVRVHGAYDELLADPDVDAVYIATPHHSHAEWSIKAAEAGKHILCEKPMSLNHAEAMAVIDAVRRHDVFFMEAFMYRCHPQTARLVELVRDKVIGEVCLVRATFSFHSGFNPEGRLWKNALAGGGILDVGCYPCSMARLIAGAANGADRAEPLEFKATGILHEETGVDVWATAVAKFPGGILAQLSTGIGLAQDNQVVIFGSGGSITVPSPWVVSREGGRSTILVTRRGEAPREITVETAEWLYGIEADTVAQNVADRQAPSPAMTWQDSLGNMKALDRWRQEVGLLYEAERPERLTSPIGGRALRVRREGVIPRAAVPGLEKSVSRLVVGLDNTPDIRHWMVMLDDVYERGGNCFDTAFIYGGGCYEEYLGRWVRTRGVRDDVVLIDKGAHTPYCDPASLTRELEQSLDRLGLDHIDLYFMHRDNPDVPVGEFVDVLNRHHAAGQITLFGGSNWALDRIAAANAYARENGLKGFGAVSNNFSLARMVKPVWEGCIAASDAASREWFTATRMPLFPWSSQARGFFVRGDPGDRSDLSLAECWYSEDNFERQERARALARRRGVSPLNIALAYVLCQPFPTFPLIGPRTIEEMRTAVPALNIDLAPGELKWLNLEKERLD